MQLLQRLAGIATNVDVAERGRGWLVLERSLYLEQWCGWNSPYINHFTQPDSIIPDQTNPQSWDRYAYVFNNPIRYTDPFGHMAWEGNDGDYTWKNETNDSYVRSKNLYKTWQATSAWGLMAGGLRHEPHMDIVGSGLEQIKNDPAVGAIQDKLLLRILKDPRYGIEDFSTESIGNDVQLGQQGIDAFNGATWMQRNAKLDATDIQVFKNGSVTISWKTRDTLDLNPDWGGPRKGLSGFFYNLITTVTGAVWHGSLDASNTMTTNASWQVTTYPYCP